MWEHHDFDDGDYWKSREPDVALGMLKTIKIYGYIIEPSVLPIIGFLMKKALVLEEMVISNSATVFEAVDIDTDELFELCKNLLKLPRASPSAVINFC